MSSESHLNQLERRHADLERQINQAMNHPSADPLELSDLKRRKLRLKDEITKMKATIH